MATLQHNRKQQKAILEILVSYWNPSGLPDEEAARECEAYVPDIYRFLLVPVSRERLVSHLYDKDVIASGGGRIDVRWTVAERVADRLLSLGIKP